MQENNFEKGIRQKMEGLSFEPSDPVWQKVELQIQQKRRRRRLVLLLLPLLLSGGAFIWYLATPTFNNSVTTISRESKPTSTDVKTPLNPEAEKQSENNITQQNNESINLKCQREKETFVTQEVKSTQVHQKEKGTFLAKPKKEKQIRATKIQDEIETGFFESELHAMILQNEIDKKEGRKVDEVVDNPFKKKETEWQKNLSNLAIINSEVNKATAPVDSAEQTNVAVANTPADSTVINTAQKVKGKRDVWQWSLHARAGVSGLRTNVANVFRAQREADFAAAPSTGSNTPQPRVAGDVKNNLAYTIGGSVRRSVSNSAAIGLGLQYSYYSLQSNVGTAVNRDTTVFLNGRSASFSNYYSNTGAAKSYTSRYHYIEVPLTIDYTPFKKLPLQLQHGVSMGYLLSSNALVQSSSSGIYLRSDDLLRKTGFNLFTSVDYRLFNAPSFSLFAGPQLQWSLTPIQQAGAAKKQHLFFAGLNTQIRF